MNKERRNQLRKAIGMLNEAMAIIEQVKEEEYEAYNNLPESLQDSEKWETMLNNEEALENANDSLNDCIDILNEVIE